MAIPKVVRDGKVAVLYSPGYGAGWSTWGDSTLRARKIFCPELVALVEAQASGAELEAEAERLFPEEYAGGVYKLVIEWLPEGTVFRIHEYDGNESVVTQESDNLLVA